MENSSIVCMNIQDPYVQEYQLNQQYNMNTGTSKFVSQREKLGLNRRSISMTSLVGPKYNGVILDQKLCQNDSPTYASSMQGSPSPSKINNSNNLSPYFNKCSNNFNQQSQCQVLNSDNSMVVIGNSQQLPEQYKYKQKQQSLEELKNWEKVLNIDNATTQQIEQHFLKLNNKLQGLQAHIDVNQNMSRKLEVKHQEFLRVVRGALFTKFSRKHQGKKYHQRIVFYNPQLEALCWKNPKEKFPKNKQIIQIKCITKIYSNLDSYKSIQTTTAFTNNKQTQILQQQQQSSSSMAYFFNQRRKTFDIANNSAELFMAIEINGFEILELIAPDSESKNTYIKVLNTLLMNSKEKSSVQHHTKSKSAIEPEYGILASKFNEDVKSVQDEIEQAKGLFNKAMQQQKSIFFETMQDLINQERNRMKNLLKNAEILEKRKYDYEYLTNENYSLRQLVSNLKLQSEELLQQLQKEQLQRVETEKLHAQICDFLQRKSDQPQQQQVMKCGQLDEQQIQSNFQKIIMLYENLEGKYLQTSKEHKTNCIFNEEQSRKLEEVSSKYQLLLVDYNRILNEKTEIIQDSQQLKFQLQDLSDKNNNIIQQFDNFYNEVEEKENQFSQLVGALKNMKDELIIEIEEMQTQMMLEEEHQQQSGNNNKQRTSSGMQLYEKKIKEKDQLIKKMQALLDNVSTKQSNNSSKLIQKEVQMEKLKNQNEELMQACQQLRCELQITKMRLKQHTDCTDNNNFYDESNKENISCNIKLDQIKVYENRNKELEKTNEGYMKRFKDLEEKISKFEKLYQEKKIKFDAIKKKYQTAKNVNEFFKKHMQEQQQSVGAFVALFLSLFQDEEEFLNNSVQMPFKYFCNKSLNKFQKLTESKNLSQMLDQSMQQLLFSEQSRELSEKVKELLATINNQLPGMITFTNKHQSKREGESTCMRQGDMANSIYQNNSKSTNLGSPSITQDSFNVSNFALENDSKEEQQLSQKSQKQKRFCFNQIQKQDLNSTAKTIQQQQNQLNLKQSRSNTSVISPLTTKNLQSGSPTFKSFLDNLFCKTSKIN